MKVKGYVHRAVLFDLGFTSLVGEGLKLVD